MLKWQVTVSHCAPQPAVMSSASYTAIYSWKQETLNPSLLYLRKIWFHLRPYCRVTSSPVLQCTGLPWCKRLCSVQKVSKKVVFWVEGQNPFPFRCFSSAPFYCWQVPKWKCIYAWITCLSWVHWKRAMGYTLYPNSVLALLFEKSYLSGAVQRALFLCVLSSHSNTSGFLVFLPSAFSFLR